MGTPTTNQRLARLEEGSSSIGPLSSSLSSNAGNNNNNNNKKKWASFLPVFVTVVVIGEIAFLGRLDVAKQADLVNSWADSFYQFTTSSWSSSSISKISAGGGGDEAGLSFLDGGGDGGLDQASEPESCEAWLEREDSVNYSRDFNKEPIYVHGSEQDFKNCNVGCKHGYESSQKADAAFGMHGGAASVLRSMESAQYYSENNIDIARRNGYQIVMTTSLSSDVPVGYFSWAEYDIMAPVQPKTEKALAAAFISNCAARNFRLQALEALERAKITIDSYGSCHRNHDGRVDKVETLKLYKFSLAFENSNEEDYVTEKFFQSLVAGSVPVVVGAPNIQDFAPAPGSLLHIRELSDADAVAATMKHLAQNPNAYNETLKLLHFSIKEKHIFYQDGKVKENLFSLFRWKYEGPSDSFKALVDMAAVHSSCRLCIFLATKIREKEEKNPNFKKRPCKCSRGSETVYHLYVRERGRFEMESIFLRSSNLTTEALEAAVLLKFTSLKHVPIWKNERPESIRGGDELKVYIIYPLGMTQRQALYTFRFKGNTEFKNHIESNRCSKFEVIFV